MCCRWHEHCLTAFPPWLHATAVNAAILETVYGVARMIPEGRQGHGGWIAGLRTPLGAGCTAYVDVQTGLRYQSSAELHARYPQAREEVRRGEQF